MQTERYIGIDYLRAFFSICVVCTHIAYISPSLIYSRERYLEHVFTVSDFINYYVLLLAVPVFLIVSSYLFFLKPGDKSVLFAYQKRLLKMAVFWIILYSMYRGWNIIDIFTSYGVVAYILSGGNTIFYHFIHLVGLAIITHFAKRLNIFYIVIFFIITTFIVFMVPAWSLKTHSVYIAIGWSPLNFLPYPFAAILVFHIAKLDKAKIKPLHIILTGILILLLTTADWTIFVDKEFFYLNSAAIPLYSRPSLVIISMVVLLVTIKLQFKRNPVIMFMSKNSLALYCLHPFFLTSASRFSGGNYFIELSLVLVLSYLTAIILKWFIRRELIS